MNPSASYALLGVLCLVVIRGYYRNGLLPKNPVTIHLLSALIYTNPNILLMKWRIVWAGFSFQEDKGIGPTTVWELKGHCEE